VAAPPHHNGDVVASQPIRKIRARIASDALVGERQHRREVFFGFG